MFGGSKVRLEPELLRRASEAAEAAGYSSVEEFIAHAIEKALAQLEAPAGKDVEAEVTKQLKGLGYLE
jgi:hypothetical protein